MPSEPLNSTVVRPTLALDAEEHAELLTLLERELRDARVEAHRTHTPDFREKVLRRETVLRRVIEKLNRSQS